MKFTFLIILALSLLSSPRAFAIDEVYGVVSGGMANSDFDYGDAKGSSYKFGIGYEFHRQWYAEFGYQRLSNQSLVDVLPTTADELNQTDFGLEADALYASILGKASSNTGELFYRLGVLNVDLKGQDVVESTECEVGSARVFSLDSGENLTLCEYDEGIFAGVFGVGFDFYLDVNLMLRTEVEHIKGENGFENNAAYLGLRYNF